ncbi:MAG: hypothetical protein AAB490_04115, partial [Patescibacteria group bacterium]
AVAQIQGAALMRYIIAIGLLMYSVRMAVSMGAAGGAIAAKIQGKFSGYAKAGGTWLARGSSGKGGAVGLAKKAGVALATRPGETIAKLATLPSAAVQLGYRGAARMVGGGAHADRMYAARQTRVAAADDRRKQKREAFEKKEDIFSRTIRRVRRPLDVGERESERERVASAGKSMNVSQMTPRQLKDELQAAGPVFGARKTAAAREMMSRGLIDDIQKLGEDEKDKDGNVLRKGDPKQAALAKEATRLVFEEAGLTPEEVDKVKERNLRHTNVESPEMQEFIRSMITEGKPFSRKDLTDGPTVATIVKNASTTLSGSEFKKFMDKIPLDAKNKAVNGLREALKGLKLTATMPEKEKDVVRDKREKVRQQMARFDPKSIDEFARKIVDDPVTGEVKFDNRPIETLKKEDPGAHEEWEQKKISLTKGLNPDALSTMTPETLEKHSQALSAPTVVASSGRGKFNDVQVEAILRGYGKDLQTGAPANSRAGKIVANFRTVLKNSLTSDALKQVISSAFADFEKKSPGLTNPYANAKKLIDQYEREVSGKSRKDESEESGAIDVETGDITMGGEDDDES